MLSCASAKKSLQFFGRVPNYFRYNHGSRRTFCNRSQLHDISRSFSNRQYGRQDSDFRFHIASNVLIAWSSLGLFYWSSSSYSLENNSVFSSADYVDESQTTLGGDLLDQDQDANSSKKQKFLFGDAYRKRIFFNYEKRMRMQSSFEKVFEYFASIQTPSGEYLMAPADLMRAIVPVFPPSESDRVREGSLRGEMVSGTLRCPPSEFFMLFDTNGDGLISFAEYVFFVTLLSIPERSFTVAFKMFDLDNNGEIDIEEFKKVMDLMRSQSRQSKRKGLMSSTESGENDGLVEYFFGKDGKQKLQLEKFVQFLRDLHDEILKLEFHHYDYKKQGTISAKDFALSLVASADICHINKFLDRVEEIDRYPSIRDLKITFDEFKDLAELRKKLQSFSMAIFSYGKANGLLTKKDFQRAASQVCGISITDSVVDIIFHVFDTNRDESLSSKEFVRVIQSREAADSHPWNSGVKGVFSCWSNCASRCSSKLVS